MSPSSSPPDERRFDLVVLVGSAGGAAAAVRVLRTLLPDLGLPVVLMLHLPPGSDLVDYLARLPYIGASAGWLEAGARLEPGRLLACPPRAFVELLPDGSSRITANGAGALDMPIDRLLQSVALSFGPRAIAIVLSGMANDGAAGARALHAAGGQVLVQAPASAEFADMPEAAIDAGAADLVVPLDDLGAIALELMAGTPRRRARSELQALARAFGDPGEVAALARELDWAATPLGPVMMWPEELRILVRTMMDSPHAAAIWWGPQLVQV